MESECKGDEEDRRVKCEALRRTDMESDCKGDEGDRRVKSRGDKGS